MTPDAPQSQANLDRTSTEAKAVAKVQEPTYICTDCGQEYDRKWYVYNAGRCHVDCDHQLVLKR